MKTNPAPLVYTGISLVLALLFVLLTLGPKYNNVARYGGATWVFLLSMIITMPIVVPYFKRKADPKTDLE